MWYTELARLQFVAMVNKPFSVNQRNFLVHPCSPKGSLLAPKCYVWGPSSSTAPDTPSSLVSAAHPKFSPPESKGYIITIGK